MLKIQARLFLIPAASWLRILLLLPTTTTTNNNDQNKIVGIEALTQGGEFNFKPNFFPATDFENF